MFGCIRGRPLNSLLSSVYIAQNSFFQKIIKVSKCLNQDQDLISATLNKVVASKERARIHKMLQPRQNVTPLEFSLMSFNVLQQTACLVVNPITVGNFAFLFNCTPVGRTSDSMMVPT